MKYLKVPVEMAQFALKERKVSMIRVYLACLFLWPGKVKSVSNPIQKLASYLRISEPTVYRAFQRLKYRNWIGKDVVNGWIFIRGLNRVHSMEGWQYSRAVVMQKKHLYNIKEFFISAVISSAIKTGRKREGGTEQPRSRSLPVRFPVPVSFLEKVLNVDRRTSFRYFNIAKKAGFIDVEPNTALITNLNRNQVFLLRAIKLESVDVQLFGYPGFKQVKTSQIFINEKKVFLQKPNFCTSHLYMGKRRIKGNQP